MIPPDEVMMRSKDEILIVFQGMSFIAAVLILNMEAPQAFVCFANLLDGPVLRAAFTRDGAAMQDSNPGPADCKSSASSQHLNH
ncbi:TBC1 domain family member 12 [Papilio machaon]|uniref:TBC1 domain family member 12 n=1 Tax=Papilio machaon TaxID=76193 RepID=A0A0N1IE45_PAPMA|nr:TBC1 domain family member 12 [Papilio machaon]